MARMIFKRQTESGNNWLDTRRIAEWRPWRDRPGDRKKEVQTLRKQCRPGSLLGGRRSLTSSRSSVGGLQAGRNQIGMVEDVTRILNAVQQGDPQAESQ